MWTLQWTARSHLELRNPADAVTAYKMVGDHGEQALHGIYLFIYLDRVLLYSADCLELMTVWRSLSMSPRHKIKCMRHYDQPILWILKRHRICLPLQNTGHTVLWTPVQTNHDMWLHFSQLYWNNSGLSLDGNYSKKQWYIEATLTSLAEWWLS